MRGAFLTLCFAGLSLAWLVFFNAGVHIADSFAVLLFLGATAIFYWTFRSGQTPPPLPLWQSLAMWALPLYAAFQLIPWPPWLLETLSPARALVTQSLGGVVPSVLYAPISIAAPASVFALFNLLGCLTIFSLLRDISWRSVESYPWLPVAPLILIATLEAAIGVGQWLTGNPDTMVRGTFSSPDHFATLLEIALPFTLVFGFISFRRHQTQESASSRPAIQAGVAWSIAVLLLLALYHGASPASAPIVFGSLFLLLALALIPRLKTKQLRWSGAGVVAAVALLIMLFVAPPPDFVESLAKLAAPGQPEARLTLWNNSASLFGDFRWLGMGLGGFESAFLKYQGTSGLQRIQNPGSDLLALLVSFGLVGCMIALVACAGIVKPAIVGTLYLIDEPRRLLAVAITASFFPVLFRCCLESSLSIPAIAMAFAWLAGLSQSSGLE